MQRECSETVLCPIKAGLRDLFLESGWQTFGELSPNFRLDSFQPPLGIRMGAEELGRAAGAATRLGQHLHHPEHAVRVVPGLGHELHAQAI